VGKSVPDPFRRPKIPAILALVSRTRGPHAHRGDTMPTSKNAQVLKYLLRGLGHVGTTKLLKLVYLADLQAREVISRPVSHLNYKYHNHGPFDKKFYSAIKELERRGATAKEKHVYPNGNEEDRIIDTENDVEINLTPAEEKILDFVVERFGSLPLPNIIQMVYDTVPMQEVGGRGRHLPMHLVDGRLHREIGFDLDEIIAAKRRAEAGHRRPAREVFDELRARANR